MLNLKKHLITGIAAAGIGLVAMSSFAQMPPPGGPGPDGRHAPSAEQLAKFEKQRARHEAQLHDKLKITAAQEGAWKTFMEKSKPVRPAASATPPARPGKEEMEKMTTPQRLDRMAEFMKKREAEMTDRIAATKEFYAVLSPEQQKVFDQEFRKMEKHRFEHGRFGRGHGRDHGGDHGGDHDKDQGPGPAH